MNGERPLVLVSNRGPVTFERRGRRPRTMQRGAGGLVSALSGLIEHTPAVWVSAAISPEDAAVSEEAGGGSFPLPGVGIETRGRFVVLEPETYHAYYNVIANPMLWFIQHYLWDLSNAPDVRREELDAWEYGYVAANHAFADAVLAVLPGSTRATAVFFTNFGAAYTCRVIETPASSGYGEPIQSLFKFRDGEKVVAAMSLDPRVIGQAHAVAVASDGYSLRFSLEPFVEPSTRAGRRYARLAGGAEVVGVEPVEGGEVLIAATRQARAILCKVDEVNLLSGPGRGVILIKLTSSDDHVLGFTASRGDRDLLTVETSRGASQTISTAKYEISGRGGKGRELLQRGEFVRVVPSDIQAPEPLPGA